MEKLFLKTENGLEPIDPALVEKYQLKAGMESPFLRGQIVDQYGRAPKPKTNEKQTVEGEREGELVNGEISQLDNGITLSQSEMYDFSQGTDSSNR